MEKIFLVGINLTGSQDSALTPDYGRPSPFPNTMQEGRLPRDRHIAQNRDPLREWRMCAEQTRKYLSSGQGSDDEQ